MKYLNSFIRCMVIALIITSETNRNVNFFILAALFSIIVIFISDKFDLHQKFTNLLKTN